jgi:hypothetical protein
MRPGRIVVKSAVEWLYIGHREASSEWLETDNWRSKMS